MGVHTPFLRLTSIAAIVVGCGSGDTLYVGTHIAPSTDEQACAERPTAPESSANLSAFYAKSLSVRGLRVLGSAHVSDAAVTQACILVAHLQPLDPTIWDAMVARGLRVAVIAPDEVLTQIPEYADLYTAFPTRDWDSMRGVGATGERPVSSVGEENLLCESGDRFAGEFLLPQTFSHGLRALGISPTEPAFPKRLDDAYTQAIAAGLWTDTFAAANVAQYFAEGVQDWLDANGEAVPPDGTHNQINTRAELKTYDPALARIIQDYLPDDAWRPKCP